VTNLVLDIGNSSLKAAFAKGSRIGETFRYNGEDIYGYVLNLAAGKRVNTISLSSVRDLPLELLNRLRELCEELLIVRGDSDLPVRNLYNTPQALGPDRISAAAGASAMFPGRDCIIFDFGTALTIDFLSKEGEFTGGNISPGMRTRLRALNSYTGKLPLVSPTGEVAALGKDTISAIESGTILGLIFEIEGYISRYPRNTIIFTGGDAIYFAEKMKSPIFVVYNLVLIGLAHIAEYNAKKKFNF